MPRGPQPLDIEVQRKGRREDRFNLTADLADPAALKAELIKWLKGKKWHPNRWLEFELLARPAGTWDKQVKVRT